MIVDYYIDFKYLAEALKKPNGALVAGLFHRLTDIFTYRARDFPAQQSME